MGNKFSEIYRLQDHRQCDSQDERDSDTIKIILVERKSAKKDQQAKQNDNTDYPDEIVQCKLPLAEPENSFDCILPANKDGDK